MKTRSLSPTMEGSTPLLSKLIDSPAIELMSGQQAALSTQVTRRGLSPSVSFWGLFSDPDRQPVHVRLALIGSSFLGRRHRNYRHESPSQTRVQKYPAMRSEAGAPGEGKTAGLSRLSRWREVRPQPSPCGCRRNHRNSSLFLNCRSPRGGRLHL